MWKKVIKANEIIAGSFMAQLMHNVTIFTYLVERKESFKIQAFKFFLFYFLKSLIACLLQTDPGKWHALKRTAVFIPCVLEVRCEKVHVPLERMGEKLPGCVVMWQLLKINKFSVKLPKLTCQSLLLPFLNACLMHK